MRGPGGSPACLLRQAGTGVRSRPANVVTQMSPGFQEKSRLVMCPKGSHVQTKKGHEGREADRGGVGDSTPPLSEPHQHSCGQVKLQAAAEGAGSQLCLQSRCFLLTHTVLPPSLVHPHDIPGEHFSNAPISQVSRWRLRGGQACTSETTQLARGPGGIRTQVSMRLEILSRW